MNCGKNIFNADSAGVEAYHEQVFLGVVSHLGDARQGNNGGAHGVGAAASDKAALLHHSSYSKSETGKTHGGPSGSGLLG